MIPQETIQKIFDACRIEEVIGDFKELKREGANFKCLSPFTNERTASCIISPSKNIWKDFSSGKGGTPLSYLMLAEKMTFVEAIKHLGNKYNIEIVEKKYSPKEKKALAEYSSMYEANIYAKHYFSSQLYGEDETALNYFISRGYSADTIATFNLGYCDNEFSTFTKNAMDSGYQIEILDKAGLSVNKGRNPFDTFKGRVIFPIEDLYGKTIGFGGRILDDSDKKQPKYRNSKESKIFDKGKVLFGLNLAKEQIIKENNVFLCEGYTDVISVYSNGVQNVVASCGTALTEDQLKLLSRFTDTVTFLFDGDNAGVKATFKSIDLALKVGLNPRIVKLPKEHDPDSITKVIDNLKVFLKIESLDFVEYKCSFISDEILDDPSHTAKAIDNIISSIAVIEDTVERELFSKKLSHLLNLSNEAISNNLDNKLFKKSKNVSQSDEDSRHYIKAKTPEARILDLMISVGKRKLKFVRTENGIVQTYYSIISKEILERLMYLSDEVFFTDDFHEKLLKCDYGVDMSVSDEDLLHFIERTFVEIERKILDDKINNFDSEDMYMLQDLILKRNRINNM